MLSEEVVIALLDENYRQIGGLFGRPWPAEKLRLSFCWSRHQMPTKRSLRTISHFYIDILSNFCIFSRENNHLVL